MAVGPRVKREDVKRMGYANVPLSRGRAEKLNLNNGGSRSNHTTNRSQPP
jgi:hypothetical protein